MSHFSEDNVVKHFTDLSSTSESIQTCSVWLQHHRKQSLKIAEIWLKELRKERDAKRCLSLVYVANDVLQACRKKWPPFLTNFQPVLEKGFSHVAKISDERTLSALHRVLQVWRDRQLYAGDVLDKVNYGVQSHLANRMLTHWNELTTKSPRSPERRSPDAKQTHDADTHKGRAGTPPPPKRDRSSAVGAPAPAAGPSSSSSSTTTAADAQKVLDGAPGTQALLAALAKLEEPPSADADIREQIAGFPSAVADTGAVKKIKNQEQADELRQSIRAAEPVVQDYCNKLAAEIEHRRETQRMLAAFAAAQKVHAADLHDLLQQFRQRRDRLVADKEEAQRHYDSLPDMSKLESMAASYLPPLPTVGELFHS